MLAPEEAKGPSNQGGVRYRLRCLVDALAPDRFPTHEQIRLRERPCRIRGWSQEAQTEQSPISVLAQRPFRLSLMVWLALPSPLAGP